MPDNIAGPELPPRRGGRVARIALTGAGAVLLLWLAWHSRETLLQVAATMRPGVFLVAVVAGVALTALQGLYFHHLMAKNGSVSPTRAVVAAFLVAQPGKYVPGKIWSPLMQKASLGHGSSLLVITASNLEIALLVLVQMASLGAACLAFAQPVLALLFLGIGIAGGAAILRTDFLGPLVSLLPRLAARLGLAQRPQRGPRPGPAGALAISAVLLLLTLLASWLVLAAMGTGSSLPEQAQVLGTLFLGFGTSLLVFLVPAGLGIRESATAGIGLLTAPGTSTALLVSVALFARAWQLAVDLLCLVLGLALGVGRKAP